MNTDPTGFWMSEKLDGFWSCWDGHDFWSKNGTRFNVPAWFNAGLPKRELIGELWAGRGNFETMLRVWKSGDGWEQIRFAVFDVPGQPFPTPLGVATLTPYAFVIRQQPCQSREHLETFYAGILAQGGEGVMLRCGNVVHKLKPEADEEAEVIGYNPSTRDAGIGSLTVRNARGTFKVAGMRDDVRHAPPAIGAQVTYFYSGLTARGLPRHPRFKAERVA